MWQYSAQERCPEMISGELEVAGGIHTQRQGGGSGAPIPRDRVNKSLGVPRSVDVEEERGGEGLRRLAHDAEARGRRRLDGSITGRGLGVDRRRQRQPRLLPPTGGTPVLVPPGGAKRRCGERDVGLARRRGQLGGPRLGRRRLDRRGCTAPLRQQWSGRGSLKGRVPLS